MTVDMTEMKKNTLLLNKIMDEASHIRAKVRPDCKHLDDLDHHVTIMDHYKIMMENADWNLRKLFLHAAEPNKQFVKGGNYTVSWKDIQISEETKNSLADEAIIKIEDYARTLEIEPPS